MDIESSTNPPYYLPNKNVANNNKFFQQGGNLQQGRLGSMNQSQNVSGNFSNLSMGNNLSLSQMNTPSAYGQPNRASQGYNQLQPQQQNGFSNNFSQANLNQQNYNQQNYNQNSYAQQGKNQNISNFNNNFQNHNYNNNGNFTNRDPPPNYQLP
jgi:hypothetical protein